MLRTALLVLALLCVYTGSSPAPAQRPALPTPADVPAKVRDVVTRALATNLQDRSALTASVADLERALAETSDRTSRGLLQTFRAEALLRLDREADARVAVEEAIRLLPDYGGPLLSAFTLELYADRPAAATDYLLRAADIDPSLLEEVPNHEVEGLMGRLATRRDYDRRVRIANRLISLGWTGDDPAFLSELARFLVLDRLQSSDVEGARAIVSKVSDPLDLRALLIDRRAEPIWSMIERQAGPRLETAWANHLAQLHLAWTYDPTADRAVQYGHALAAAGHYDRIVRDLGPLFADLDAERDYDLLFIASTVADAYARLGRWDEADALFERGLRIWPLGQQANAINLAGNRAGLAMKAGQFERAVSGFDAVIEDAQRWGGQVGRGAMTAMHLNRACALHALNRSAAAAASMREVMRLGTASQKVSLHLCAGDLPAAKRTILEALDRPEDRLSMLAMLQPPNERAFSNPDDRRIFTLRQALRHDPDLRAAAERHGRILPFSANAGAPAPPARI